MSGENGSPVGNCRFVLYGKIDCMVKFTVNCDGVIIISTRFVASFVRAMIAGAIAVGVANAGAIVFLRSTTEHDGAVTLANPPRGKHIAESDQCLLRFGDQDASAGLFVESVDWFWKVVCMFIVVSFVVVIVVLFVAVVVNVIADAIVLISTSIVPICRRGAQHKRQKGLQIVPTLSAHGIHSLRFIDHGDFVVLINDHAIVFFADAIKTFSAQLAFCMIIISAFGNRGIWHDVIICEERVRRIDVFGCRLRIDFIVVFGFILVAGDRNAASQCHQVSILQLRITPGDNSRVQENCFQCFRT